MAHWPGFTPSSRAIAAASAGFAVPAKMVKAGFMFPPFDWRGPARFAGVQAAKRTAELIPLAHPLPLSFVDVEAVVDEAEGTVTLEAEARTTAQTGVEMEAMCACAVAALTVYDMVKGLERGVAIERVELLEKTGGRHDWKREA